ncbi:hypothetical protein [Bdellovibrio sp. HCB288]|uniref:hypothetical protein n=1 Tax=Bdellovibrio sp. HCB288 TaxID=3394355 RepID=UPI0039B479D2
MSSNKDLREYSDEELSKELFRIQQASYGNYKHDAIAMLTIQEMNRRIANQREAAADKQYDASAKLSVVSLIIAGLAFLAQILQMLFS